MFNKYLDILAQADTIKNFPKDILLKINIKDESEMTFLAYSVNYGNLSMSKILLKNGANPNCIDIVGNTPLIEASLFGYFNIVQLLLKNGSNVNHQNNAGETALSSASTNCHLNIVEILILNGADKNLTDNMGCTALEWALSEDCKEIIALLSEGGGKEGKGVYH